MALNWDLALVESFGGGDITLLGNDLAVDYSIGTSMYLRMFGGNVEASTTNPRDTTAQDFSYWGNAFILDPKLQFNSLTERTLNTTPLTSNGRIIIENAIKKDLEGLDCTVSVAIVATDKINITLTAILPNGSEKVKTFSLVRNPDTGDFDLNDFDFRDFF